MNFDFPDVSENLYDHAFQLAESIRAEIFDTTQCTASIGVGVNKFLAGLLSVTPSSCVVRSQWESER